MALALPNAKIKLTTGVSEGTAETVYTASANSQKITSIRAVNTDGVNSGTVSVFIANGGTNYFVQKLAPVPAGGALNIVSGDAMNVATGDVIKAYADATGKIDVIISYAEIS